MGRLDIKLFISQKNTTVGDIEGNFEILKKSFKNAVSKNCDFFITPELSLTGYPAQDLLLRKDFIKKINFFKKKIYDLTKKNKTIFALSIPTLSNGSIFNSLLLIQSGKIVYSIQKNELPNYGVFDERRYFVSPNQSNKYFVYKKKKIQFLICEDMWSDNFSKKKSNIRLDLIIVINASPFETGKFTLRKALAKKRIQHYQCELVYINTIGSQDDLIFDGGSFCMNKYGNIIFQEKFFDESEAIIDLSKKIEKTKIKKIDDLELLYRALMVGLRSYMLKNGFSFAHLGLSGGIDSALTLTILADTIESKNISSFFLPSKFSSKQSKEDAYKLSSNLGIKTTEISIEMLRKNLSLELKPLFKNLKEDLTEENIQSRLRGIILMALSNKFNSLLITTGNKSELAVGYSTLYGDMCGGYSLLKDVYKTRVFELCNWRNKNILNEFKIKKNNIIPEEIIKKEPTAELRYDQKDSDILPPYKTLDKILSLLIDENRSLEFAIKKGFSKNTVKKIWKMIKNSEFKRYQSSIGPKVTKMSLSADRRFPITNKFDL